MTFRADLHTHTTRSDGTLSPTELVTRWAGAGVHALSITDHDSMEGMEEALEAAARFPELELIPGVELSVDTEHGEVHMLGFWMDWQDRGYRETLARFQESRVGRARTIAQRLTELGAPVTFERIREIAGEATIGRPHVAQALLEAGHVKDNQEAFDRFLAKGKPAYVERDKTTPEEAVRLIRDVGGVAVLAHPNDMGTIPDVEAFLAELVSYGLQGMEVDYGSYPQDLRARLRDQAARHHLVATGGSDYHGRSGYFEGVPGGSYITKTNLDRLRALARPELTRPRA